MAYYLVSDAHLTVHSYPQFSPIINTKPPNQPPPITQKPTLPKGQYIFIISAFTRFPQPASFHPCDFLRVWAGVQLLLVATVGTYDQPRPLQCCAVVAVVGRQLVWLGREGRGGGGGSLRKGKGPREMVIVIRKMRRHQVMRE